MNFLSCYQLSSESYFYHDCDWLGVTCQSSGHHQDAWTTFFSRRLKWTFSLSNTLVRGELSLTATSHILISIFMITKGGFLMFRWPLALLSALPSGQYFHIHAPKTSPSHSGHSTSFTLVPTLGQNVDFADKISQNICQDKLFPFLGKIDDELEKNNTYITTNRWQ